MDKFEMLLNELTNKEKNKTSAEEQREIVIRYTAGKEEEAKVVSQCQKPGEDSYAALFAVGKMLGEHCDIDGKKIGKDLVIAATKGMIKAAMGDILNDLEELING